MTIESLDAAHKASQWAWRSFRFIGPFLDHMLPALRVGRLRIALPNGGSIERRGGDPEPAAAMAILRWRALWRMLYEGGDGFANGYVDGDWSTPDLPRLLDLGMRNETTVTSRTKRWLLGSLRNRLRHMLRANTRRGSRGNIAAHYDLGNSFFGAWLDAGMHYSSALYRGSDTLEQAQERKLDRIADLLELRGGEAILEIGCGWGGLAQRLLERYKSNVFAITLSSAQLRYARRRLAKGIEDGRADLQLLDYRDVHGHFDRVVSIEMIEAVGERFWSTYFAKIRSGLRRGGIVVIQAITIAESRFAAYRRRPDFIQRHIFPGGMLSIVEREAERAGLQLVCHESFGDSYAKTLCEWRTRFLRSWPSVAELGFDERFKRIWEYYLAYCEVGFRSGAVDVGLFKFVESAAAAKCVRCSNRA